MLRTLKTIPSLQKTLDRRETRKAKEEKAERRENYRKKLRQMNIDHRIHPTFWSMIRFRLLWILSYGIFYIDTVRPLPRMLDPIS